MNLKSLLKNILCISTFLVLFSVLQAQVVVDEFEDNSNYKGTWEIKTDIPKLFCEYLREKYNIFTISPSIINSIINDDKIEFTDKKDLLNKLNAQYKVQGKITKFSITRFVADLTRIAGYDTYSTDFSMELALIEIKTDKTIFEKKFDNTVSDIGIGARVFGNNTDRKKEFQALNEYQFGSEQFMKTFVARNLIEIFDKFSLENERYFKSITSEKKNKLPDIINSFDTTKSLFIKRLIKGKIISLDKSTNEVFINLGAEDNINPGETINIYTKQDTIFNENNKEILGIADKKIAEIEIIEVRGNKFSLGIINNNFDKVQEGMEVRKILIIPR